MEKEEEGHNGTGQVGDRKAGQRRDYEERRLMLRRFGEAMWKPL